MPQSTSRLAAQATTHCLTGCAIGEILGVVIATARGLAIVPGLVPAITLLVNRWLTGRGRGHAVVHGAH